MWMRRGQMLIPFSRRYLHFILSFCRCWCFVTHSLHRLFDCDCYPVICCVVRVISICFLLALSVEKEESIFHWKCVNATTFVRVSARGWNTGPCVYIGSAVLAARLVILYLIFLLLSPFIISCVDSEDCKKNMCDCLGGVMVCRSARPLCCAPLPYLLCAAVDCGRAAGNCGVNLILVQTICFCARNIDHMPFLSILWCFTSFCVRVAHCLFCWDVDLIHVSPG